MPSDDVLTLLMEDHQEAERVLKSLADADWSKRGELFAKLADTLVRHEVAEEVAVYPVLRDEPGGAAIADARIEEQYEAADLLSQMEQMDPSSEEFDQAFNTLKSAVLEHAGAEEQEVFPRLQDQEDQERLIEMGERYNRVKESVPEGSTARVSELAEQMRKSGHFVSADEPEMAMRTDRFSPDKDTEVFEARDALAAHKPDRMPTLDEERAAEEAAQDHELSGDPKIVAAHYRDMTRLGMNQQGEGRIP